MKRNKAEELVMLSPIEELTAELDSSDQPLLSSRLAEDDFELNFDSIFKSCLKDQDAGVRSKAIEGLCENEEPSLINPFIELLEQDGSEKVQAADQALYELEIGGEPLSF